MWQIIDKENLDAAAQMERFVAGHEKGHFMQLPRWAQVKSFWDWQGILVYREDRIAAVMSVLIRPLPLGLSLLYAPRGPVCDRNDHDIWKELMAALKQIAKEHRSVLLYIDPDEPDTNDEFRRLMRKMKFREQTDDGFGNIQPQFVFRLALDGRDEEGLYSAFSQKTRYNIRLARRKGVTIRAYSGSDNIPETVLDSFAALMETTGQRDHFQVRGKAYFKMLLNALGDDAGLYMAYYQDMPIAGTIEVFCGRKAWYLYGASSNEHRNVMPNYLLQWTMIRRAMAHGCDLYDFRGVPGDVSADHPLYGLYRFKKGFAGDYTKFSGLFAYSFVPLSGMMIEKTMRLRRRLRSFRKSLTDSQMIGRI